MRENIDERYLSCNCLEDLEGDTEEDRIQELRHIHPLTLQTDSKFSVHQVGRLKTYVENEERRKLSVAYYDGNHASYCGLEGLRFDDQIISDLIAECIERDYQAKI